MSDVILYIATSADGYIARRDGRVDWLDEFSVEGEDFGYAAFMERVGALVMGGATYRQVLGFGEWPYGDLPTTVMTRQGIGTPPKSTITAHSSDDVNTLLVRIRAQTDGAIWLVGGAQINALFGAANAIDEVILSIMPVFLGDGIPLFQGQAFQQTLARPDVKSFSTGVVQITYRRP